MLDKNAVVLGIGTDIGKTFLVESLCKKYPFYYAIKPIISGFKVDENSDTTRILNALNLPINQNNLDLISPWRYEQPISPNFVDDINFDEVIDFCKKAIKKCSNINKKIIIEGIGGVMSPLNSKKNFLDVASSLKLPTILVCANYLGSISHVLTSVKAIEACNLQIDCILLNHYSEKNKPISDEKFIDCLHGFINYPIKKFTEVL